MKIHFGKCFSLYFLAAASLLTPSVMEASNITLEGLFTLDDNVQLFDMAVATSGTVDIRTYSYAGGLTSTGRAVPSGGFDPILTLFNSAGMFLTDNDEGIGVATDPSTGEAFDARITTNLTPGSYIVALTQFDNFAAGDLAKVLSKQVSLTLLRIPHSPRATPARTTCFATFPVQPGDTGTETGPLIL